MTATSPPNLLPSETLPRVPDPFIVQARRTFKPIETPPPQRNLNLLPPYDCIVENTVIPSFPNHPQSRVPNKPQSRFNLLIGSQIIPTRPMNEHIWWHDKGSLHPL